MINNSCNAATIVGSCGIVSSSTVWPRKTFTATCSVTADSLNTGSTYKIGIFTSNYTTTKVSGNGSNLDYENPEHRFKVNGPDQAGTPANITTSSNGSKSTPIKTGITGVTNYSTNFDISYITYEADVGDTTYQQPFILGLYIGNGSSATSTPINMDFTIERIQHSITTSAPPTANVSVVNAITPNAEQDSNTFTVNVKANSTWLLKTQLSGNLLSGGDTIPVSSEYFRATGSGFSNLASTKTQFATAGIDYNVAQNSAGVYTTGSSDGISLNTLGVQVIYTHKTTSIFSPNSYTTNTTLLLNSP